MVEIKNLATALQMLQQTDGVQDALQALSGLAGGAATPAVPGLQIFAGKAKEKTPEPHAAGEQSSTALPTPPATIPAAAAPTSAIQNGEADQVTAKAELGDGPEAQSANGADKNLQDYEEAAFAALQRKRGPGLKRPAAAPSKTTPAGSKKPLAGHEQDSLAEAWCFLLCWRCCAGGKCWIFEMGLWKDSLALGLCWTMLRFDVFVFFAGSWKKFCYLARQCWRQRNLSSSHARYSNTSRVQFKCWQSHHFDPIALEVKKCLNLHWKAITG